MGDHDDFEDNQFPENDEFVPYVTGATLAQKNGEKIAIWGKVTKVSPSEGFYINTVDDQEILVKVDQPLTEPLEGWYEIYGIVQGRTVLCDEYVSISADLARNIDTEGHKALTRLLEALDDPWNLGEDPSELDGVMAMD